MNSLEENGVVSKFLVNSNDAVEFKLVREPADISDGKKSFNPGMSHQIFGAKENIFGYSDLKVQLYYTAANLFQYYKKSFDVVITKTDGGIDPDNIEEKVIEAHLAISTKTSSS